MAFGFRHLEIPEVILIQSAVFEDARGRFAEIYKRSEFQSAGIPEAFVQQNYSFSIARVLRGLHYQKEPKAQGKLIRVIRGEIYDVAVDIRRDSPTYGCWVGEILSEKNCEMLYVPKGFAHGFCVLSKEAGVIYEVTTEYAPELEGGILWNEPNLGIQWPLREPILSPKDSMLPLLGHADHNFAHVGGLR